MAVTRAAGQSAELEALLRRAGAEVLLHPLIRIEPAEQPAALVEAAGRLHIYDWVVFTSANGVAALVDALGRRVMGGVADWPPDLRVAAVGPATARALQSHGIGADLVSRRELAAGLGQELRGFADLQGMRVLWPRAQAAGRELAVALQEAGAQLDEVEAYRTELDLDAARRLHRRVVEGAVDVLTFTSASNVESFRSVGDWPGGALVAAIGPITAASARRAGMPVDIQPQRHTAVELAAAIRQYYEHRQRAGGDTERPGGPAPREKESG